MSQLYVFLDEAGNLSFHRKPGSSRYFILCTVIMDSYDAGNDLLDLRRKLGREGTEVGDQFHVTTDRQEIRDLVFNTICRRDFWIQVTIMEKSKSSPRIRLPLENFYKHGWQYHFFEIQDELRAGLELHVTAAAIGERKERRIFKGAISDVMRRTIRKRKWSANVYSSVAEPCLQVADYCAWAIRRKWELGDTRSYDLIKDRITNERNIWINRQTTFY